MAEMKNMRSMLVSCILLIVTGLIITSIFYVTRLRKILNEEADRYLTEISQILSSSVKGRVQTNLRFLQSVSLALPDDMDYMSEENFLYLQKEAYDNAFISMGITGLDGQLKTIDGKILDISKSTLFRRVMLGESVVEASFLVSEDTDATLVYLTPIRKEEKIVAALVAHVSIDHLRATLNVESFAGKGYSYIIDSRGAIVVSSANENSEQGIKNLFEKQNNFNSEDSKNMQQDLGNGLIGSITYSIASGERKIAHYAPIGINDWFLISVVPEKMINAQTDGLIWFSTAANSITLIIVLLVCGLIFYMQRGLQRLAFSDPVTGGHNGSWFIEEAHRIIKAAAPFEYAMVSVDIEDFKLVNDFFGHAEGDRTLKYIFQRIQKHIYPNERAARMSEDNFYILIDNDSEEEVLQRLEELIQDINSFNYNSDSNYYLNLSMGVFIIDDINLELISIKDRADVARKNKEKHILSHGGTCVFYTDTERQKMVEQKEITNHMDKALQQREFIVYLQPKFELKGSKVAGAEALVRWQHPSLGLLSPASFISVFENNGFIVKVDLFVFEEVCRKLRAWIDQGIKPITVSVNLSRVHLNNPQFMDSYLEIFEKYNLSPSLIEFELTETLVIEDTQRLIAVINEIHAAGFLCALDDFGSGYSSLNLLKEVPVDVLKLDKAFFDECEVDTNESRSWHIVRAVIELAKKLDMKTVSEGVEIWPQVEILKGMDCDMVQGYVFSKPVTIEEFEKIAYTLEAKGSRRTDEFN